MIEAYKGEIEDWYDDSEDYEKVMMVGKKEALGVLGYPKEYQSLSAGAKAKIAKLFAYD